MTTQTTNPAIPATAPLFPLWWAPVHASSWDRVREALHRDWEQTKADFSATKGLALNQDAADTVRQAVGVTPIPSIARSNTDAPAVQLHDWTLVEPAIRYGFSARLHFADYQTWNDEVEDLLRRDWESVWGRSWEHERSNVHRGWDAAGHKP